MSVGIGHDDPAGIALADADTSRPEGDEALDLRLLITVRGWSEVEVQPALPGLCRERRTVPAVPADLRTAARGPNRGLEPLVQDERPAQRGAEEVPDLRRTVAGRLGEESAAREPVVARLDDAEFVAFGVSEHHMSL